MRQKDIIILGIESSCDDTSAAVLKNSTILSNLIARQEIHELYGGVVPELASRAHQQNIIPVVDAALKKAGITKEEIDAIAFTKGPGLMGSLVVGTSFAKAFSMAMNVPLLEVNHMMGHVLAHFIDDEGKEKPTFPFLCLTVSGGHTQIVLVEDHLSMKVIGTTIDDAAGEAFDKAAKLLGFPYPGGPLIDKFAIEGDPTKFTFAKPNIQGLDFSFSGLKTSILYFLQKETKLNPIFIIFENGDYKEYKLAIENKKVVLILCQSYKTSFGLLIVDPISFKLFQRSSSSLISAFNILDRKEFRGKGDVTGVDYESWGYV